MADKKLTPDGMCIVCFSHGTCDCGEQPVLPPITHERMVNMAEALNVYVAMAQGEAERRLFTDMQRVLLIQTPMVHGDRRMTYLAEELAGTVDEYLDLPCASLARRMQGALDAFYARKVPEPPYDDQRTIATEVLGRLKRRVKGRKGETSPTGRAFNDGLNASIGELKKALYCLRGATQTIPEENQG